MSTSFCRVLHNNKIQKLSLFKIYSNKKLEEVYSSYNLAQYARPVARLFIQNPELQDVSRNVHVITVIQKLLFMKLFLIFSLLREI